MWCYVLWHHSSILQTEAPDFSKTSVPIYQITSCHIPEDCNLNTHCCVNLKSVKSLIWLLSKMVVILDRYKSELNLVESEVLTAVTMRNINSYGVTLCSVYHTAQPPISEDRQFSLKPSSPNIYLMQTGINILIWFKDFPSMTI